jgi:N6-adenosine-specific RNA methylase IME4
VGTQVFRATETRPPPVIGSRAADFQQRTTRGVQMMAGEVSGMSELVAKGDTSDLALYTKACQALAEAKTVDEVKGIRDKASAMRVYAQQAKNRQLEVDAAEIRMRAERRLGEMLRQQKETTGLNPGGRPTKTGANKEPVYAPPLADAGIDKKLSARAQKMAAVPEDKFEGMLDEWRDRVEKENERVTTNLLREGERVQRDEKLEQPAIPADRYSLIYADPPWRYDYAETKNREIENQYPTMDLDELCSLPAGEIAADDCVLFLWTTSPKLEDSMRVIEAWGFRYRTCAVWDKERMGMGYYFRQQHEILLVATKGALGVPDPSTRVASVFRVRRDPKHSTKPPEVAQAIEAMYPNAKKIELFCRSPRAGWSVWGNQAYEAA